MHNVTKWSDTKILQEILQDFQIVSDHFRTLCIKSLKHATLLIDSISNAAP